LALGLSLLKAYTDLSTGLTWPRVTIWKQIRHIPAKDGKNTMETNDPENLEKADQEHVEETELAEPPVDSLLNTTDSSPAVNPPAKQRFRLRGKTARLWAFLALLTYIAGLGSGYVLRGMLAPASASDSEHTDMEAIVAQINPKDGYQIPATYGEIGPRLVETGAIDLDQFVNLSQDMGRPLTEEQLAILTEGSSDSIMINQNNQHFLLNLFWAFGLANQNRVLTEGPMMRGGKDQVVNFASTGGWTLATRPVSELYASSPIVALTEEQQKRMEEVAQGVYRPCCDNPTHFPDCNHGMAMLGLLELMASQDASVDEMFQAAKYVNAYWFPQQTLEVTIALKETKNVDFERADARLVVGRSMSSGSGFQTVHAWLAQNGKLGQAPQSGGSCGVR
jgi:hypothetical protein